MKLCARCGRPMAVSPSSKRKYCSPECRRGERYVPCPVCGKLFLTWDAKKAPKTCGSQRCSKSRSLSDSAKRSISTSLTKPEKQYICEWCGKTFYAKRKRKYCSPECRPKFSIQQSRLGAYKSLSSRRKSAAEDSLAGILPPGFKRHDRELLNGLEIDFLYDNLAVEYNSPWHYSNFHDHYESLKRRDAEKSMRLKELGFNYYVIEWAIGNKRPRDFFDLHAYYIKQLFEDISPFKFNYRLDCFKYEYDVLCRSRGKTGYICRNAVNWYHRYRWSQKTSTHNCSAIDAWESFSERIIENRLKYSTLSPVDLRRYFLLFDYTPSLFPELLAKNLAKEIDGDTIYDPFAGYGNRMLGVCAAGKRYMGNDLNSWSVSANVAMASDLGLNAECRLADSSDVEMECDGIITCPPYEHKDDYGVKSRINYYDMLAKVFSNVRFKKGFIVIKPSLVDMDRFMGALPRVVDSREINWGGLNRRSIHLLLTIAPK